MNDEDQQALALAVRRILTGRVSSPHMRRVDEVSLDQVRRYLESVFQERQEQAEPPEWDHLDPETLAAARNTARLMLPRSLAGAQVTKLETELDPSNARTLIVRLTIQPPAAQHRIVQVVKVDGMSLAEGGEDADS